MRLTKVQQRANEAIIDTLRSAGWKTTDRGRWFGVADLTYDNGRMSLYVGYRYRSATIGLTLTDIAAHQAIRFSIEFDGRLEDILEVIVSWEKQVSRDNFRDMMEDVVRVCPETNLIQGPDGDIRTRVEPRDLSAPGR